MERIREVVFRRPNIVGERRPSLVALGGGSGLSSLLKGLKDLPVDLTAVVTVTDDGGSSGRLRKDLQILPPGDIRNCLVALSQSESLLARLFQFRFVEAGEFSGHSFGNLFIAAMTELLGDFGSAVREASSILAIRGHVIPVTCENVQLAAIFVDGTETIGETAITGTGKRIAEIRLIPEAALPNPETLNAIDQADMIVLGPGSLYTSVIPNLLVSDVADRINRAKAPVVYICNVMTQPGETDRFTAADHVDTLLAKTSLNRIDAVIVNCRRAARPLVKRYEEQGQFWVPPTVTRIEQRGIKVISGDFLSETNLVRHDSITLAHALFSLIVDSSSLRTGTESRNEMHNDRQVSHVGYTKAHEKLSRKVAEDLDSEE
ncbi:MAG: uridine diphosphate-N-acetylglucosamine-binding protein YvcK [Candidatus Riflebacteria bacterium]|nr:uridine diphosphate-N-acetylglucosamine-binding protein YvcK [Candidatus Riflebacteria bacterium]